MAYYQQFSDVSRGIGEGGALYVKEPGQSFYSFVVPMDTVPMLMGARESFDYTPTTSPTKGKVPGRYEIEDKDFTFLAHRENFYRLDQIKDKSLPYLVVTGDYSGFKFTATLSCIHDDITSSDSHKATGTFVGQSISVDRVEDALPLLMPTAKFESTVPEMVLLSSATGAMEISIETSPAAATLGATMNQSGAFTAVIADKKLTITGTNTGNTEKSGVVYLKATATNHAPWTTTIHVRVPGTST